MREVTLKDIYQAHDHIKPFIIDTHLEFSKHMSDKIGSEIFLKHENLQITGSFKPRGAINRLLSLNEEQRENGIVTASSGNHAQGVAFGAKALNLECKVLMPVNSPQIKLVSAVSYGADVTLKGDIYDESFLYAKEISERENIPFIHPFEDHHVIAGQGTIGLEIFKKLPEVSSIVVPIGGGGLISGISIAMKTLNPACKIYGVVSKNSSSLDLEFHKKSKKDFIFASTIADGTMVKRPSEITLKYIHQYVDDIISVSEEEIEESILFLLERLKTLVEGSGALAVAGVLHNKLNLGKKSVMILSGGNIDLNLLAKVIQKRD